jgi:hypothetical protein
MGADGRAHTIVITCLMKGEYYDKTYLSGPESILS